MRTLSLVLFSLLLVSCGKDKNQNSVNTANPSLQVVPGQSTRRGPQVRNQNKAFAVGGCQALTAKTEAALNTFMSNNLFDKERAAVHCVTKEELDGKCSETHTLFTYFRKRPKHRKVVVRKRVLKSDLSATKKIFESDEIVVGKRTRINSENFRLGHNTDNELESISFVFSRNGIQKKLYMPVQLVKKVNSEVEHNCSTL